jgi:hypothetical protein
VIATLLLVAASALPLGVWPTESGDAAITVDDVEIYVVEPEASYGIIAVQPLALPLKKAEPASVRRLVAVAKKLGADAVLLLGELTEKAIPEDPDSNLPVTGQYSVAVFLVFDEAAGWDEKPTPVRRSRQLAGSGTLPALPEGRRPSVPALETASPPAKLGATDSAAAPHH